MVYRVIPSKKNYFTGLIYQNKGLGELIVGWCDRLGVLWFIIL
jgi:hypothetical protein